MTHWEVVWVCFGLTLAVMLWDGFQTSLFERKLKERLLLSAQGDDELNKDAT